MEEGPMKIHDALSGANHAFGQYSNTVYSYLKSPLETLARIQNTTAK